MLLAMVIFLATLVAVVWRPRGLGIGWSALGGAAVALAAGVVGLHVLARKGMEVGWGTCFRIRVALTIPVLVLTLLALDGWLRLAG